LAACEFYGADEESTFHALLDCTYARCFWSKLKDLIGIKMPKLCPRTWFVDLMNDSGCVWFTFLGQPGSRGAGERRLVACTAPRARLSRCNFPPLACIPRNARNGRFCRARLGSCSCFSH
jgi:hypothetical protein